MSKYEFGDPYVKELYVLGEDPVKMSSKDHSGHRERLKNKIAKGGPGAVHRHELLESMLYYIRFHCDTRADAIKMIESFRGTGGLLDAPLEQLRNTSGVGGQTALFLKVVREVYKNFGRRSLPKGLDLSNFFAAEKYYLGIFNESDVGSAAISAIGGDGFLRDTKIFHSGELLGKEEALNAFESYLKARNCTRCVLAYFGTESEPDRNYRLGVADFAELLADRGITTDQFFTIKDRRLLPILKKMSY